MTAKFPICHISDMCQNMTVPLVDELYAKMSPRQVGNEEIKVCDCEGEVGELEKDRKRRRRN